MSQSAFFFQENLLCSYILIGNRVPVKSSGMPPGVGKCPVPGQCKICKCPTPGTDNAGKCPAVARGRGLGAGGIDWCIIFSNKKSVVSRRPFELTRELRQSRRLNITAKFQYHLNWDMILNISSMILLFFFGDPGWWSGQGLSPGFAVRCSSIWVKG